MESKPGRKLLIFKLFGVNYFFVLQVNIFVYSLVHAHTILICCAWIWGQFQLPGIQVETDVVSLLSKVRVAAILSRHNS